MRLPESWWASLVYAFDLATLSSFNGDQKHQTPILQDLTLGNSAPYPAVEFAAPIKNEVPTPNSKLSSPIIKPPYPPNDRPDQAITCDYSAMGSEWKACNTPEDRSCWLKGPGDPYDINTNYEIYAPNGTIRKYVLDLNEMAVAPDGVPMRYGKVFNNSLPGPWIQACWGDEIEVTVRNYLRFNGTTIHWHGIRQLENVEMDGVNGVTQCPIAPGQEFTYRFKAMQYGSSWYHSHYSLQYADGLVGPLTIYGPSSDNYDLAEEPILMTDWNHRSAFEDWSYSIQPRKTRPLMTNILLNGKGRYVDPKTNRTAVETPRYTKTIQKGKRYLLRLINTSVDTAFVFAIDGHNLTVIGSDFVALKNPYSTRAVMIGIGQRYHVILDAKPITPSEDDNYWVRTIPAVGCGVENFVNGDSLLNNTGLLRYNESSKAEPTSTVDPHISPKCSDEPYELLTPKFEWNVGKPSNEDVKNNKTFEVGLQGIQGHPYQPTHDRNLWAVDNMPLWLEMGRPTILNLNTPKGAWPKHLAVTTEDPRAGEWIYLVITAPKAAIPKMVKPGRFFFPVAHPIHLHGHDFAILKQSTTPYPGWEDVQPLLKLDNPPRRDVALLPIDGYLVIAFKADNPGTWLLHCHIAWHASSGLGMQIVENAADVAKRLNKGPLVPLVETCNQWDDWVSDARNHYNPIKPLDFQDDSGV